MNGQRSIQERFFQCLINFASYLDDKLRLNDFRWNRTVGGPLDRALCRHSYEYLALPALVSAIIFMGVPEFGMRLVWSVLAFIATVFLLILFAQFSIKRNWSVRADLLCQVAIVLAAACIVWLAGGNTYHRSVWVYRHFFVLSALVVGVTLVIAGLFTSSVWRKLKSQSNYDQAITKTELFLSRGVQIPLGWDNLLYSFLTVIPGAPLQLLLPPAIVILLAPPSMLPQLAIGALVVSYGVLLLGGLDARLDQMWRLLQSAFFRGGTLLVSLIIITLAAARLFEVTYVTTIFDTAEGVVIALLLFNAYVLFWWFDYWVNRLLAQELIKLLNAKVSCDAQVPYPTDAAYVKTSVSDKGRVLQIHGASRFIVIGSSSKYPQCFQTYTFDKLFESLATAGLPGGKAIPSPGQIAERIVDFKYLTGTVLFVLSVLTALYIHWGVQMPELAAESNARPDLHLAQLLTDNDHTQNERPALIIAASGGGTRAALYTAAVMEGLASSGRIEDVIMGSGVSGGGAALAYFAGKRPALVEAQENAWNDFFNNMSKPFIKDVINGAPQWRIVSSSRLGVLLAESFEQLWTLPKNRNKLGEVKDFGLILNTAIAGRFACEDTAPECSRLPLITAERRFRKQMTRSDFAGGRLILTNLALRKDFVPSVVETGGPEGLPVVVDDPATRLEIAAALNANFPPVFSNAAIDVDGKFRYWVTDGGAVDNRGIEMSLYALLDALNDPQALSRFGRLPAITVVVVDASAYSSQYAQDRGVGTMMGAGTQFASLLVKEQLQSIRALYEQKRQSDSFRFVYLPMPLCLRESGSFGTHWMLQPTIKIALGPNESRSLKGSEMIDLLRAMHGSGKSRKLSLDAQAVLDYAVQDVRWNEGARKLGFIPDPLFSR